MYLCFYPIIIIQIFVWVILNRQIMDSDSIKITAAKIKSVYFNTAVFFSGAFVS